MNSNTKTTILGVVFAIIFILAIFVFINWDYGRSYTINDGMINATINENGTVHIRESYVYNFDGTYNGVKRNIPLKSTERIQNLKIYTINAYSEYDTEVTSNEYNITTYLYTDSAKTQKISNSNVTVIYEYDMDGIVKMGNNHKALFQFKLKGGSWDKPINGFTAYVNYPSRDGIIYYINPYEYNTTPTSWENSTIKISTDDSISTYLEINSLIPENQLNLSKNYLITDVDYEKKVIESQNSYISEYKFGSTYYPIMILILLMSLLVPAGIYKKYGREPTITYDAIYERTPPTDDSPAFVNAMSSRSKISDVGTVGDDAFKATIMDLIDRKYLILIHSEDNNIKLQVSDKDFNNLKDFEVEAINLIRRFEVNGIIDFDYMSSKLQSENTARDYINSLKNWKENFRNTYISEEVITKFFDNKGAKLLKYHVIIMIIISIIFLFIAIIYSACGLLAGILIAVSIFMIILLLILQFGTSNSIWGRWTVYGKEYNDKWNNFRKYLSDFSLMEEYPPESVIVWNKYLIYATSLGVAQTVSKAMNKIVYANSSPYENDAYSFYYYGGYNSFTSAINTGYSTVSSSDSSSGSVGGGSGGGGGGAF